MAQPMHNRLESCGVLYREHRAVQEQIAHVEASTRAESPDEAFLKGLRKLVNVLEHELPPHFAKEEEALFPVMEAVAGRGFPPIEVMKAEHRFLLDHFHALREASSRMAASPRAVGVRGDAAVHIGPLLYTLEDHILKEDTVLLVMAAEQLAEADDSKILRVFDEIDREGRRWS